MYVFHYLIPDFGSLILEISIDKINIYGFKVTVMYNLAKTLNTKYNIYYRLFCEKCKKSDSLDEGGKTCKNAFLDL